MKTIAWINGYQVVRGGTRLRFDEAVVRAALSVEAVDLEVALGVGDGAATAYGCDLSKGYVDETRRTLRVESPATTPAGGRSASRPVSSRGCATKRHGCATGAA